MAMDPSPRRFYVITTFGEVGPVGVHEFQDLLDQERIRLGDLVRATTGKPLGSVADLMEGRVAAAGPPRPVEERRRRSSSGKVPMAREGWEGREGREGSERSSPPWRWILPGAVLALLVVLLIANLATPGSQPHEAPAASLPVLNLVAGARHDDGSCELLVRTDAPLEQAVDVLVRRDDAVATVVLDPPGGLVTMRGGTSIVALWLQCKGPARGERVRVSLVPGAGYQVGSSGSLEMVMALPPASPAVPVPVPAPAPAPATCRWDPPSLAWEPFAYRGPSPRYDGGKGWGGPWRGVTLVGCVEPFPALAAYPQLPATQGHGLVERRDASWEPSQRQLAQTIASGTLWMSCRLQQVSLGSGNDNWIGVALAHGGAWRYILGCGPEGGRVKWYSGPIGKDEHRSTKHVLRPPQEAVLEVLRLVFTDRGVTADTWLDAASGREPQAGQAQHAEGIPSFSINCIHLAGGAGCRLRLADLRLGRTWQEVVPP